MGGKLVNSVIVRFASRQDENCLLRMPPYAKSKPDCLSRGEEVLVAESDGIVYGAVSISHKDVSCVYGEWENGFEKRLGEVTRKVSGGWIWKLYVFPEYRYQGIGTLLVEKAVARLKERDFAEAYAGIYVENEFREVSEHIFKKRGFNRVGYCICLLANGHCRGVLLRKTMVSGEEREKE